MTNILYHSIKASFKLLIYIIGVLSLLCVETTIAARKKPITYDAVMGISQFVVDRNNPDFSLANKLYPHAAATAYFQARGLSLGSNEPYQIKLLKGPNSGELTPNDKFPDAIFIYKPNDTYKHQEGKEGPVITDQMIFSVEVKGKKFKVIYKVVLSPGALDLVSEQSHPKLHKAAPNGFHIEELPNPGTSGR